MSENINKKDSQNKQKIYFLKVFSSRYCIIVFLLALLLSYFLIPRNVFYTWQDMILIFIFMLSSATLITCVIRDFKERIILTHTYKKSLLGIIITAIGLSALQVCGFGAPICGAAIGLSILSAILPHVFINFLTTYSIYIIGLSIILQLITLYYMRCFQATNEFNKNKYD